MVGLVDSLWSAPTPPSLIAPLGSHGDGPSSPKHRFRAILVFFSHRMCRGGPRLLIQIAAFLITIPLLLHLDPARLTSLPWSTARPRGAEGIRIVAFGSQDLAGSSVTKGSKTTWTRQLCSELPGCTSYLSLVPEAGARRGLTSNSLYGAELGALEEKMKAVNLTAEPAQDYEFLSQQYPVPNDTPDLDGQISKFLALPPPIRAPRQTLWVFTFGTWDVWSLAAFPRETGEQLVDALVDHIFARVELLYLESLNPESIAFSDFWANTSEADINRLAGPFAGRRIDRRELESFRVVIPQLTDITLAPGWQKRPAPPLPHSRAEQMRNADYLTRRWNERVRRALDSWTAKGRTRPEGFEREQDTVEVADTTRAWSLHRLLPEALQLAGSRAEKAISDDGVIYAPYPRRSGLELRPAEGIVNAMTEEELQRTGLRDGLGRGTLSSNDSMRFLDVWTPCTGESAMGAVGTEPEPEPEPEPSGEVCASPDDHLFYDGFTVGERAIRALAATAAERIGQELFVSA